MRTLLVGDIHLKRSNIEETRPLFDRIIKEVKNHKLIIIMGDIYNDHGVVTADVQREIVDFFDELEKEAINNNSLVFNLEGNHDQAGDGINSSLYVHRNVNKRVVHVIKPQLQIINDGFNEYKIGLIPYIRDNNKFIEEANKIADLGANLIYCHQEFDGSVYENGMYAPNGIKLEKLPSIKFISGHIHQEQEFDRIWYIGAPRWLSKSDANKKRGIWSIDGNNKLFISSSDICPEYHLLIVNDDNIKNLPDFPKKDRIYIEYNGSLDSSIKEINKKYKNNNIILKHIKPKTTVNSHVSETKGLINSIRDYIDSLETEIDKDLLKKEIFTRLSHG